MIDPVSRDTQRLVEFVSRVAYRLVDLVVTTSFVAEFAQNFDGLGGGYLAAESLRGFRYRLNQQAG